MAITTEELKLFITAEVDAAVRNLAKTQSEADKAQKKLKEYAAAYDQWGAKLTKTLSLPLAGAAAYAVKAATDFEKVRTTYGALLGDVEKGNALFEELKTFSASTPLSFDTLNAAAQNFLGAGFAADELTAKMRMLGDVALGDADKFSRLSMQFNQVKTKGKAELEELKIFAEAGIPIFDELAKMMGVSTEEIFKMTSEGKIGFEELNGVLTRLTGEGGKFHNMMQTISGTTAGSLSNALDNLKITAAELGEALLPIANDFLQSLTGLAEWIGELDEGEKKMLLVGAAMAAAVGPALKLSAALTKVVAAMKAGAAAKGFMSILSMLANPALLAAVVAVGAVGAVTYSAVSKGDEQPKEKSVNWGNRSDQDQAAIIANAASFEEAQIKVDGLTKGLYDFAKATGRADIALAQIRQSAELTNKINASKDDVEIMANSNSKALNALLERVNSANPKSREKAYNALIDDVAWSDSGGGWQMGAAQARAVRDISQSSGISFVDDLKERGPEDVEYMREIVKTLQEENQKTIDAYQGMKDDLADILSGKAAYAELESQNAAQPSAPAPAAEATNHAAATLGRTNDALALLSQLLNNSPDLLAASSAALNAQQQINALWDKRSVATEEEKAAIDKQIEELAAVTRQVSDVKNLRDGIAEIYRSEEVSLADGSRALASIVALGNSSIESLDAESAMQDKRREILAAINEKIKENNKIIADTGTSEEERLAAESQNNALKSAAKTIKQPNAVELHAEGLAKALDSGDLEAIAAFATPLVDSFVNGIFNAVEAVENGGSVKEAALSVTDGLFDAGISAAAAFAGPFGGLVQTAGEIAKAIGHALIDAFDWRNGLRDKLEEAKAPIDDLFADIESREEELAKKRNQMIDDQLEKTKAAYDEQMAIMDARFSTEKKLLEDMYQAGVITAAEYEKGLMDLAKEEASEKNKAESEYNDKTEELNYLKELSQQVEDAAKTVLENTKTAYKDQFNNSYEAGLSVKGSGKVGGLLGSRAEAADRLEQQITDLQDYIISLANGEYTEEEMLKKLEEFKSNDYILAAANGADFIADKPTLMMVGEAGPEHVKVKPAPFDVPAESGGSAVTYTVVINNPVGIDGLTQQVVAAAKKLNNRGIV